VESDRGISKEVTPFLSLDEPLITDKLCPAARDVVEVQKQVAEMLEGRRLIGHNLNNDLKVCFHLFLYGYGIPPNLIPVLSDSSATAAVPLCLFHNHITGSPSFAS